MTMKIESSACKIPKKNGEDSFTDMKKALLPLVITDEDTVNKNNSIVCKLRSIAGDANSAKCKKPVHVSSEETFQARQGNGVNSVHVSSKM